MPTFRFTSYFERNVLRKRPYLKRTWCIDVLIEPIRVEREPTGRIRFWGSIPERPGYYLRVVTLEDGLTIHNVFFDRRFRP